MERFIYGMLGIENVFNDLLTRVRLVALVLLVQTMDVTLQLGNHNVFSLIIGIPVLIKSINKLTSSYYF